MPIKKTKTLKTKNVKRKTGAKAQSKQILALSTQINKLTKTQFEPLRTSWQRAVLPVDPLIVGAPYICPIPYSMGDPLGQLSSATLSAWSDNLGIAAQPTYRKRIVFGHSGASDISPEIHHTGGILRYRFINEEPAFTTADVYLVRPKRKQSDQISVDRKLRNGSLTNSAPGAGAFMQPDIDYTTFQPDGVIGTATSYFGSEINRKYWTVLGKRSHSFSHPGGNKVAPNTADPANTRPANNSIVATGSFKLPAGGVLKNSSIAAGDTPITNNNSNAMTLAYLDEENEKTCYLVVISNGASVDLETLNLGFVVNDYYKAVV